MPDRQLATDMHGFGVTRIEQLARRGHDLRKLKPREFEQLIAELWHGFGYDVDLTKQTRDGGKDIIAIGGTSAGWEPDDGQAPSAPHSVNIAEHRGRSTSFFLMLKSGPLAAEVFSY